MYFFLCLIGTNANTRAHEQPLECTSESELLTKLKFSLNHVCRIVGCSEKFDYFKEAILELEKHRLELSEMPTSVPHRLKLHSMLRDMKVSVGPNVHQGASEIQVS